jgi:hypothetical protein
MGSMIARYVAAAILPVAAAVHPESPLTLAWRHTGAFWVQTGLVMAHHWFVILVCAAVPAVERGYRLLRARSATRSHLALMDFLVTLWRIGLCIVAIWAGTSGREWHSLSARVGVVAAWQFSLEELGSYFAHHLRMLIWAAGKLLDAVVSLALRTGVWVRETNYQQAAASVLRNLILVPLAVIYLVEMARPIFRQ